MTSSLIECLHFPTLARVSGTVKRVIVPQGLISIGADYQLWFIIVGEGWNQVAGLSRHIYVLLEVLIRTAGYFGFTFLIAAAAVCDIRTGKTLRNQVSCVDGIWDECRGYCIGWSCLYTH